MEILLMFTLALVSIAGLVEIAPLFALQSTTTKTSRVRPDTPLEMLGRQIYAREGCFNCHSQTIRPMRDEAQRYDDFSLSGEESAPEPAFQWGSKRTGPDLAGIGELYSDGWHVDHLIELRSIRPESVMPSYRHLATAPLDYRNVESDLKANSAVGVAYTDEQIANAEKDLVSQANPENDFSAVVALQDRYGENVQARDFDGNSSQITEMDALVAYLQALGTSTDTTDTESGLSSNQR